MKTSHFLNVTKQGRFNYAIAECEGRFYHAKHLMSHYTNQHHLTDIGIFETIATSKQ